MQKNNSDSKRPKRANVVCIAKQENSISLECEPESASITTENSIEAANENKGDQSQGESESGKSKRFETKHIIESCKKVVSNGDIVVQNGMEANSIDTAENKALKEEEQMGKEIQSEERIVQQTDNENAETAMDDGDNVAENKSSDTEKAESNADSEKEEHTNNSGNSDTTEGDDQTVQREMRYKYYI